jgi:hypothetical protein
MKTVFVGLLLAGLISMSGIALAQSAYLPQDVYKWLDSDGVTHYAAQAPLGVQSESTGVRVRSTNQESLQARAADQTARIDASNTRSQQEREISAENKATAKQNRDIREQNCAQARQQQKTYNEARRLYRTLENGDREYLTSDELDGERAGANSQVQEWCS